MPSSRGAGVWGLVERESKHRGGCVLECGVTTPEARRLRGGGSCGSF